MQVKYVDHLPAELAFSAVHLYMDALKDKLMPIFGDANQALNVLIHNLARIVVITRECREPSYAFEEVTRAYFKPGGDFLAELIGRSAGKPSADHHVRFALISMIALLETFGLYGHLIDAVAPGLDDHFKKKNGLAKHIVHHVLAAANSTTKA